MKATKTQQKTRVPRWSYAGFLFQTFIRRPFGYVIPCLYCLFLAIILIIVPKILRFSPLFIWNIGGFNMPVFNLFFIAASAAALAVSVFRTGREDGTELSLSSKPLTKGAMVGMKVLVYLVVMLGFCVIANIITLLTLPVFGVYNEATNVSGISYAQYLGLNLSVLLGNMLNMLLFGGIAVLITMVGGQVITMIGTVGIVFVMCLMNFIYPQVITSSLEVLRNKYGTEILSYSCPTYDQYGKTNKSAHKTYATIACVTDQDDEEINHFDTATYWKKAEKESGGKATNYIDIARQLSSLYNAFGLDESKLKEASKLSIGANQGYEYNILENTHVEDQKVIAAKQYPIAFYGMTTRQGIQYPQVLVIGGDMGINTNNWYALSKVSNYDFDSVSIICTGASLPIASPRIFKEFKTPFTKIYNIGITDAQKTAADALYDKVLAKISESGQKEHFEDEHYFSDTVMPIITADESGAFFPKGEYKKIKTGYEQYQVITKIHFYWAVKAHEWQKDNIKQYCEDHSIDDTFPYSSKTVKKWYHDTVELAETNYYQFKLGEFIYKDQIQVRQVETGTAEEGWDKLVVSKLDYAETYSNLYQYGVTSFYSTNAIITIWSIISLVFFSTAIVIYKKTDFK